MNKIIEIIDQHIENSRQQARDCRICKDIEGNLIYSQAVNTLIALKTDVQRVIAIEEAEAKMAKEKKRCF